MSFVHNEGNHDWYMSPQSGNCSSISRHIEIDEGLAKKIIKYYFKF